MLKKKIDVFKTFNQWKVLAEKRTELKVTRFRTDNDIEFCMKTDKDMEFCTKDFKESCRDEGIFRHHTHTVIETPQHNGGAKE